MARQIGTMLNAREPKVVNGPEILNKFVGQSEENIRKLFADAEKEVGALDDVRLTVSKRKKAMNRVFTSSYLTSLMLSVSNEDRPTAGPALATRLSISSCPRCDS